jgi:hypothetical protein
MAMPEITTLHFNVTCQFCSGLNELTVQGADERLMVSCSCCGAPLGNVSGLYRSSTPPSTAAVKDVARRALQP